MERRNANRRCSNYKKHTRRRNSFLSKKTVICCSLVLISSLIFVFSSFADAHNENEKYYTSVYVNSGDTLWDISDTYCSVEYSDKEEYIKEVMQLNHLTSTEIHSGNYLIVPYYDVKPL